MNMLSYCVAKAKTAQVASLQHILYVKAMAKGMLAWASLYESSQADLQGNLSYWRGRVCVPRVHANYAQLFGLEKYHLWTSHRI